MFPPRFAKNVAFIQVDLCAEEMTRGLALQGKSKYRLLDLDNLFKSLNYLDMVVNFISLY